MNNFAKEVYYFVLPFLDSEGKPIDAITQYYHYNMEMVKNNRNQILSFLASHFNIHPGNFRVDEFMCDKSGKRWTNLENFNELEILEIVIGLGIAVGLIKDSLIDRFTSIKSMVNNGMYLNKREFLFDTEEDINNYLEVLRDCCLHLYIFQIDKDTYSYMNKNMHIDESQEAMKDRIIAWLKSGLLQITDNDIYIVSELMKTNFDKFLNCVVTLFEIDEPEALLINLRLDPKFSLMNQIAKIIEKYNDSQLEDLDNRKRIFLDKIKIVSDFGRKLK